MKPWITGLAGVLTCALLSGCIFDSSNWTKDNDESGGGPNFTNPIQDNLQFMKFYNCWNGQSAIFWKKASEPDTEALHATMAAGDPNPLTCGKNNQASRTIEFVAGTAYDVWTVRIAGNCHHGGDDPIDVDPKDLCFKSNLFRINGTNNDKTRIVGMN